MKLETLIFALALSPDQSRPFVPSTVLNISRPEFHAISTCPFLACTASFLQPIRREGWTSLSSLAFPFSRTQFVDDNGIFCFPKIVYEVTNTFGLGRFHYAQSTYDPDAPTWEPRYPQLSLFIETFLTPGDSEFNSLVGKDTWAAIRTTYELFRLLTS